MDSDRPLAEALVEQVLEAATWAPTHGLTEPWRFLVYTGSGRQRLADALPALYDATTPAADVRPEKREKLGSVFLQAPVVIAIVMARDLTGKIPELEDLLATGCAVQNLHLAASAAGLAGMWSTPPVAFHEASKPLFGLAEHERCLGFFFLGWPKPGAPTPRSQRRPLEEKVRWIRA